MIEDKLLRCPQCASPTEQIREGRVSGTRCPKCGWSVVTTETDAIDRDASTYQVRVRHSDFHNETQVKTVARLAGINFLQARRLLQEEDPIVFQGGAREVLRVKAELDQAHLLHSITPSFNW